MGLKPETDILKVAYSHLNMYVPDWKFKECGCYMKYRDWPVIYLVNLWVSYDSQSSKKCLVLLAGVIAFIS